jgi:hypothetical protein
LGAIDRPNRAGCGAGSIALRILRSWQLALRVLFLCQVTRLGVPERSDRFCILPRLPTICSFAEAQADGKRIINLGEAGSRKSADLSLQPGFVQRQKLNQVYH